MLEKLIIALFAFSAGAALSNALMAYKRRWLWWLAFILTLAALAVVLKGELWL